MIFSYYIKIQIEMQNNQHQKGLGCADNLSGQSFGGSAKQKQKSKILKKTHERYLKSEKIVNIFEDNSDDSS